MSNKPHVCDGMAAVKRGCVVAVRSAFGGFGTYFAAPLRRSKAAYLNAAGAGGGANEHIELNVAIAALEEPRPSLFLDPGFAPQYVERVYLRD
jgi:hypothetical protein